MDENLKKLLNNINEQSIAKIGELLADADKKLFAMEREKLNTGNIEYTANEKAKITEFAITMQKEAMDKYINELKKEREGKNIDIDLKIMDAKSEFRQVAIVFDTVKLIIENRKTIT
jgi:O6-methylguanine-DNA--protein-cysteine methyltransferase